MLEEKFARLWTQCQNCQGSLHADVLCTRYTLMTMIIIIHAHHPSVGEWQRVSGINGKGLLYQRFVADVRCALVHSFDIT